MTWCADMEAKLMPDVSIVAARRRVQFWMYTESTTTPHNQTHTHTCLTAFVRDYLGWAGSRKAKPIWILLKQETVSGSGISWAICNFASSSRQITMSAPHHSVFYRPDALLPPNQQHQSTYNQSVNKQYSIVNTPSTSNKLVDQGRPFK